MLVLLVILSPCLLVLLEDSLFFLLLVLISSLLFWYFWKSCLLKFSGISSDSVLGQAHAGCLMVLRLCQIVGDASFGDSFVLCLLLLVRSALESGVIIVL
jgi:hypothetical protein